MYKCPNCNSDIKKGVNKCPNCEQELDWTPVKKGEQLEEKQDIRCIKSTVMVDNINPSASTVTKAIEKLYNQMFNTINKLWVLKSYRVGNSTKYEADLNILVTDQPTVVSEKKVAKPVINNAVNAYDKYIAQKKINAAAEATQEKPEYLDFAKRLQNSVVPFKPGN